MKSVPVIRFVLTAVLIAASAHSQVPRIDTLVPAQGPIAGGTLIAIRGANLAGASVSIDSQMVVATEVSSGEVLVTTPRHDNGYALVEVSTAAGVAYSEFLYVPPKLADLPPGYITTIAGVGLYSRANLPAITADFNMLAISTDSAGNIYGGSPMTQQVLRIRAADGILERFAGNGIFEPLGDGGPATEAAITFPRACVVDANGFAYIPDESHRIRRVDTRTGIISTIAGTGVAGFSGDGGPATSAKVDHPTFLAVAPNGTLYFLDFGNARIRRIATDGTISTIAGNGTPGYSGDGGPATLAQIGTEINEYDQDGLALDPRGFLYLAETLTGRVRRIDLGTGIISTFLPRPGRPALERPRGLSVDRVGNLLVGTLGRITRYRGDASVVDSWGNGTLGFSPDGTPLGSMRVSRPTGTAVAPDGNILFTDSVASRVRRINLATGLLETAGGIGPQILGVPGPAIGAALAGEHNELMFLPSGELLVTDGITPWIFAIDRDGSMTPFGGTGLGGLAPAPGDGRHISGVNIAVPVGMASDGSGGFFMTDTGAVWAVDAAGTTRQVARAYESGFAGDGGPATEALLNQPWDVALDREGNLFIADTNNNRIRRIDKATGIITTVAGSGPPNRFEGYGEGAYCGDGGPALEACFNTPYALAVDADGNIFVNDTWNERLRKIDGAGIVRTFTDLIPTGKPFVDGTVGLFVHSSNRIMRILPDGTSWSIAGTGGSGDGFAGDGGPATLASIRAGGATAPIDVDNEGNLFFHDTLNRRFRAIRFGAVLAPPGGKASSVQGSQIVGVSRSTATPLEANVTTSDGRAAPNVRVDFTAPSSSASCVFAGGAKTASALTDRDGRAKLTCTTTCAPGSFIVTASPLVAADQPAIGAVSFSITSSGSNPLPHIDAVSRLAEGLGVQVRGTGFSPCSAVRWNGVDRASTFISTEELRAAITTLDLAPGGTAQISVSTPAPGGGVSNSIAFPVAGRRRSVRR